MSRRGKDVVRVAFSLPHEPGKCGINSAKGRVRRMGIGIIRPAAGVGRRGDELSVSGIRRLLSPAAALPRCARWLNEIAAAHHSALSRRGAIRADSEKMLQMHARISVNTTSDAKPGMVRSCRHSSGRKKRRSRPWPLSLILPVATRSISTTLQRSRSLRTTSGDGSSNFSFLSAASITC